MKNTPIIAALVLGCGLMLAADAYAGSQTPGQTKTENAALSYWMAFALLQEPAADAASAALLERVANGQAPWDEAQLGRILDANNAAINTLRRGATVPTCDWGLDYELGPRTPVAHLPKARALGRLTALAGLRSVSRGQMADATDTWLAGIRFSEHVAQGGSLISLLTARTILGANLRALTQAAGDRRFDEQQTQRITAGIRALPQAAFDWGAAIQREQASIEVMIRQLANSADPASAYRDLTGVAPAAPFTLPIAAQMQAYLRLMNDVATTLRLAPDSARQRLQGHDDARNRLPPLLRDSIPSLRRINDTRAEIEGEKQKLLAVLGSPQR